MLFHRISFAGAAAYLFSLVSYNAHSCEISRNVKIFSSRDISDYAKEMLDGMSSRKYCSVLDQMFLELNLEEKRVSEKTREIKRFVK